MPDQPPLPPEGVTSVGRIHGYCPNGCGPTLFAYFTNGVGNVVCGGPGSEASTVALGTTPCPNPGTMAEVMADAETEHVVYLAEDSFTIRHPLREHAHGFERCPLHAYVMEESTAGRLYPPWRRGRLTPGNEYVLPAAGFRYRVAASAAAGWTWEPLGPING